MNDLPTPQSGPDHPSHDRGPIPARQPTPHEQSTTRPWADPEPAEVWPPIPTGLEPAPDTSHLLPAPYAGYAELQPVTGDAQVFKSEQQQDAQLRRTAQLRYVWALVAFTVLGSIGMGFGVASSGGPLLGAAIGGAFLLSLAFMFAFIGYGMRRQTAINPMPSALATPGPGASGHVYSTASPDEILGAVKSTVSIVGLQVEHMDTSRLRIVRPAGPQTRLFHLIVDVRPAPDQPGRQLVSVLARPQKALVFGDGGAAQQLADTVLRSVPGRETDPAADRFRSD